MFYIKLLLVVCFISQTSVFAGDHKGSGGNNLDCGERSYLLDFALRPGNYPESTLDVLSTVELILEKMASFTPERAKLYKERLNNFFNETTFIDGSLGTILDIGLPTYPNLPAGCKIVQAAIQKNVVFGNEKRFYINLQQWNKLSVTHKAGLILHELLYFELQSKDSFKLGAFNAYLFRNINEEMNQKEFYTYLKDAEFKWVYLHGIPMNAQTLKISDRPISAMATVADMPFKVLDQEVLSEVQFVDSYPTGIPRSINYKGSINLQYKNMNYRICGESIKGCKVAFNPDRSISWLNQVEVTDLNTGKVTSGQTLEFNKDGMPRVSP